MSAALGLIAGFIAPPSRAATAVIIGTTFIPDPSQAGYLTGAMEYYVDPTTICGTQTCGVEPVTTPEQIWPFSGPGDMTIDQSIAQGLSVVDGALLDQLSNGTDPIVVFGNSQSSTILTLEKRSLAGLSEEQKQRLTLVLIANPNRPNGGLLERIAPFTIPGLDLTASGATPTDTGITTIDIVLQYDAVADFPQYPLNILADLNLLAGAAIHDSYLSGPAGYTQAELLSAINDPANRQTYGDTIYITVPAKQLPLLVPLREWGERSGMSSVTTPLADLIEPTLRVLVELGYDRSTPYGEPAKLGLFPKIDQATLASELAQAARSGAEAALADIGGRTTGSTQATPASTVGLRSKVVSTGARIPAVRSPGPTSARQHPDRKVISARQQERPTTSRHTGFSARG